MEKMLYVVYSCSLLRIFLFRYTRELVCFSTCLCWWSHDVSLTNQNTLNLNISSQIETSDKLRLKPACLCVCVCVCVCVCMCVSVCVCADLIRQLVLK